jgi:hypothetical protein
LRGACDPAELVDFIGNNLRLFAGSVFRLESQGRDLIIKTIAPGAWIGSGGRWVKGMSACLKNGGRVNVKQIPSIMGSSSSPFRFHCVGMAKWAEVFSAKVVDKVIGHEARISSDNSHNYLGDIWGLDMPQAEFDRLHKLVQAIDESARLRSERRREESVNLSAQIRAECPNIYFAQDWEIIGYPAEWLEWCQKIALALTDFYESKREGVTLRKLRLGVYKDHIYIGGTCRYDDPSDTKMVHEVLALITPLGGDVVPNENYPGQYLIVKL